MLKTQAFEQFLKQGGLRYEYALRDSHSYANHVHQQEVSPDVFVRCFRNIQLGFAQPAAAVWHFFPCMSVSIVWT